MLTQKVLCRSVHPSDWFVTIDLIDVYFHVFIYPVHRKFLKFAYQGATYKFQGIPFGLSLAPRVLSKCVEAALFPLGKRGVRIFSHINDCLYVFTHESRWFGDYGIESPLNPRFHNKWGEESFGAITLHMGLCIISLSHHVSLSEDRKSTSRHCLTLFQLEKVVTFRLCLHLPGLMASVISVVHLGCLWWGIFSDGWHLYIFVLSSIYTWQRSAWWLAGHGENRLCWRLAYLWGWGCPGWLWQRTPSCWGEARRYWARQPMASGHFLPHLYRRHVLVNTDNSSVVAYINHQGGTQSLQLHRLAWRLVVWGIARFLSLQAAHVAVVLNSGADLFSRGNPLCGEWRLHLQVVVQLWLRYGQANVDLFGLQGNTQWPLFFSLLDVRGESLWLTRGQTFCSTPFRTV